MFASRLEKVFATTTDPETSLLLALPGPNLRYLTGYHTRSWERFTGAFFSRDGSGLLIVPKLDEEKARQAVSNMDVLAYSDAEGPLPALRQLRSKLRVHGTRIGVEDTTPLRYLELLRQSTGLQPVDASGRFTAARLRKEAVELGKLRAAQQVLEAAFRHTWKVAKPGITEVELALEIEREARRRGAEAVPFAAVQSGPHSALPHFEHSTRILQRDEVLLLDIGCILDGYHADITRTIVLGKASSEVRRVYETVLRAQEAALGAIRPGVPAEAVDAAARQVIMEAGYGAYFIHRTGHGLGLEVHEEPYLRPGNPTPLEPGMVITVEPGVYLPERFGVRLEDDVVVTPGGSDDLTALPKALD